MIFTEHRDTLTYLHDRIATLLGRPEAVVVIHGSIGREERLAVQESFRHDPEVQVLLATDAAGEEINLQRAHLMVNYDLPWNPNRLEQRFGRIHRIGQTEVCHLWNLVADETREGDVYRRLLEKLEQARQALGGQVFDVLGKLQFEGRPLRDLLMEAIRYGDRPEVRARLTTVLDRALDRGQLQDLLDERALAHDAMDARKVHRIREDMERAVDLDVAEADKDDVDLLHSILRELLMAAYPTKKPGDFKVQPYTLGIQFHDSGLAVDLVPVIPIPEEPGFGWQPSSRGLALVKTSVSGQLAFIKVRRDADRRYRGLVRLAKQWRNQHELPLRSFAIELLLAHLLDQEGAARSLEDGLIRFFLFVAQTELREPISFPENGVVLSYPSDPVVVLDPVNSDNNVTKRITEAERQEIVAAAIDAWERLTTGRRNGYIGETLECWKDVFGRSFVVEE